MDLRTSAIEVGLALLPASVAWGQFQAFGDRGEWQAAAGPASAVEDFQGFAGDTEFRTHPLALAGGAISISTLTTLFTPDSLNFVDVPPFTSPALGDSTHARIFTNLAENGLPTDRVRIDFATPATAMGFRTWNAASEERGLAEVYAQTGLLGTLTLTNGNGDFAGFVLTGGEATHVIFRSAQPFAGAGETFGLDALEVVNVPAPWAPAAVCAGALGVLRRRATPRAGAGGHPRGRHDV